MPDLKESDFGKILGSIMKYEHIHVHVHVYGDHNKVWINVHMIMEILMRYGLWPCFFYLNLHTVNYNIYLISNVPGTVNHVNEVTYDGRKHTFKYV